MEGERGGREGEEKGGGGKEGGRVEEKEPQSEI